MTKRWMMEQVANLAVSVALGQWDMPKGYNLAQHRDLLDDLHVPLDAEVTDKDWAEARARSEARYASRGL